MNNKNNQKQPKLSVCIISYNHEKYIAQTIESVLMQKVNFPMEIIIHDDASTDSTPEIIKKYAALDDRIKPVLRKTNIKSTGALIFPIIYELSQGKYIALCEGDDYWTNPNKLQKQIDFLDNNQEYTISSHNVKAIHENKNIQPRENKGKVKNEDFTLEYVILNNGGSTCSLLFRNNLYKELPAWVNKQSSADGSIQALWAARGKWKYFSEPMGVYRIHDNGAYSADVKKAKANNIPAPKYMHDNAMQFLNALDEHFNYKYSKILNKQRAKFDLNALSGYTQLGDFKNSKIIIKKLLPHIFTFPLKSIITIIIKSFIIYLLPKKLALSIFNSLKKK